MTFLEALRSHRGGLVRIKTQLYWYSRRGWDGVHDRVCLLLNADNTATAAIGAAASTKHAPPSAIPPSIRSRSTAAAVLLLVDGAPHWVWVAQADVELLS